jgi:hypothetical protein
VPGWSGCWRPSLPIRRSRPVRWTCCAPRNGGSCSQQVTEALAAGVVAQRGHQDHLGAGHPCRQDGSAGPVPLQRREGASELAATRAALPSPAIRLSTFSCGLGW